MRQLLIGVARAEAVAPPGEGGQAAMFGDSISAAVADAAATAAQLRAIDDTTPDEFEASRRADRELRERVAGAARVFDLWTAEPFDSKGAMKGARDEALLHGDDVIAGQASLLADRAGELAHRERFLHWPLAFAEVFARERPGFDAVVGNPPWEEVRVEELAFTRGTEPGSARCPRARG